MGILSPGLCSRARNVRSREFTRGLLYAFLSSINSLGLLYGLPDPDAKTSRLCVQRLEASGVGCEPAVFGSAQVWVCVEDGLGVAAGPVEEADVAD